MLRLLFYALALLLPLSAEVALGKGNFTLLMPAEPLIGLLALLVAIQTFVQRAELWKRWTSMDTAVVLFFVAMVPGVAFSGYPMIAIKYFVSGLAFAAVGYVFVRVVPLTRTEWLTAASCLAIGTFALATWVMIGFLGQGISHEASYVVAQPFVPLGHTNLTAMIEPVFILGISFYFLLPSKRARQALALALLFLFATIDFSWSRSAFITSSLTLALFIFLSRPNTRKQVIFLLLPVVLIPMGTRKAYEIIHENYFRDRSHYDPNDPSTRTVSSMFRLLNPYSEEDQTSMAERIQRWKIGWNMFLQRPFTGIGPGCFADLHYDNLMQGRTPQHGKATKIAKRKMNLHNGYLSWIVEGGLPWALAGLWLCIQILLHLFRLGKATAGLSRWGHPLRIGLLLYFVHFSVQAIFQDFSHEPRVIILFWIGTALVTSVQPRATSES